ncbi:class I SAM-dependent methyltransferase [Streptomyces nigra]|uniref:class I SAM-dependent methyltransferase n=1 Tax=Streptomyces nigra TaxID=1827580 RepID=UPI003CC570BD
MPSVDAAASVRAAAAPADPTAPVRPAAAPADPTAPVRPAAPPADPTAPVRPAAPPADPTAPVRPAAPPADPTAPVRPAAPPADPGAPWSADPYARALGRGRGPLFLRRADGWLLPLDVERWCADADAVDREVLRRCEGAVLDVGCGPGRLVAALARQGRTVLGIDVSEAAVARTARLGGPALRRSVFDPLPGEGRWGTALLIDGNIGIGGDPAALLARLARLVRPGGLLLAETVPGLDLDERVQVHVTDARGADGPLFPWARLGTPALLRHAAHTGWRPAGQWTVDGRSFAALRAHAIPDQRKGPATQGV